MEQPHLSALAGGAGRGGPPVPGGDATRHLRDGLTYVALVPFEMHDAGFRRRGVPYFGTFLETNIRLYSVDVAGRHGVLFRSLDCARAAVVLAARTGLGVPYMWARMPVSRSDDVIRYESVRRWPHRGLRSRVCDLRDDLLGASGVLVAGPPLRPLWSPGVHTRFGLPVRVT